MKVDVKGTGIDIKHETQLVKDTYDKYIQLKQEKIDFTGWVNLPVDYDPELLEDIKKTADEIRNKASLLIVVGIGGSFLGAKAVIDALNGSRNDYPEIVFAGFNMSAAYLNKISARIRDEAVCMCVISKSGTTTEPMLSYAVLKEKMFDKYGEKEGSRRIYVITDKSRGVLRQETVEKGYKAFDVPDDIGGRYSVLSPVGLLPIAAAGHDIDKLIKGARDMALSEKWENSLLDYTVARVSLQRKGKCIEVMEYFEANLHYFGEWLKQLFCESEGKEGKGVFTTCLCFSRDLHSVGQFLQQGSPIFYETLIRVRNTYQDCYIPETAGYPYAGKTLETINNCSAEGVIAAHKNDGIPIITVEIPRLDEYNIGQLIYFFEMSCALSAMELGVNPFDQPGVEAYKTEMKKRVMMLEQQ